jgi:CRISPR-associated protein Cmr4
LDSLTIGQQINVSSGFDPQGNSMTKTKLFWLHSLTPLHVGAGRGLGYIDLPIVRERVTNYPYIPGSAIKGVIADYHKATDKDRGDDTKRAAFGKTDSGDNESGANSGSLVFTDARLIALPIRSIYGTFAWTASPMILKRLLQDLQSAGIKTNLPNVDVATENNALVGNGTVLARENQIFLEDLDLQSQENEGVKNWAEFIAEKVFHEKDERDEFVKRFAVLHDDVFNFLCETGTEVAAHIKIDNDKKTAASGALWYEESLPAETILAGILWCDRVFGNKNITQETLLETYGKDINLLQFGGKATTGKGLVRCRFSKEGGNE